MMFEKFGEFDSAAEMNKAAEGFKDEGDTTSLMELAEENGIDKEDAEDYANGDIQELVTVMSAAFGRLDIQQKENIDKNTNTVEKITLQVIITMIKGMCTEEGMSEAVMKKGKKITDIYSEMRKEAEKHRDGKVGVSCGTDRELIEIIKSYYMESEKAFTKKLKDLYR